MKTNINIPGWNNQDILELLGHYSAEVPEGGTIIELGAMLGRSTYSLGHNKKDSVKLITIDRWHDIMLIHHRDVNYYDDNSGGEELELVISKYKENPLRLESADCIELWKIFTTGIKNNEYIHGLTNIDNSSFPIADFIYHDASHDYEDVKADLIHWFPKLKQDGNFILDDYEPRQFAGLVNAVDQFVDENNLYTEMITGRNILLRRKA